MVYQDLKAHTVDGPAWTFIQKFDKKKDGRAAVLALKQQCEGETAKVSRKNAAYALIKNSVYRGPRRNFQFHDYVERHQNAYNELEACDEPVPETKKVTDFLAGIQDPSLTTGKSVVLSDQTMISDFSKTQLYLSTLVTNTDHLNKTTTRTVAATGRGAVQSSSGLELSAEKNYSNEEWWGSLNDEERATVTDMRVEKEKKQGGRPKKKKGRKHVNISKKAFKKMKRRIAALEKEKNGGGNNSSSEEDDDKSSKGGKAGNEFGRAAHKKTKK